MFTSLAGFILFCVAIYTLVKIQETHKNVELMRKEVDYKLSNIEDLVKDIDRIVENIDSDVSDLNEVRIKREIAYENRFN